MLYANISPYTARSCLTPFIYMYDYSTKAIDYHTDVSLNGRFFIGSTMSSCTLISCFKAEGPVCARSADFDRVLFFLSLPMSSFFRFSTFLVRSSSFNYKHNSNIKFHSNWLIIDMKICSVFFSSFICNIIMYQCCSCYKTN